MRFYSTNIEIFKYLIAGNSNLNMSHFVFAELLAHKFSYFFMRNIKLIIGFSTITDSSDDTSNIVMNAKKIVQHPIA